MLPEEDSSTPTSETGAAGETGDPSRSRALVPVAQPVRSNSRIARMRQFLSKILWRRRDANLRVDLEDALSGQDGRRQAFSAGERKMINSILLLQDVRVEDLMVPRADIIAVEIDITLGELMKVFEDSGHSRMPVYKETLDDPRGMVHIRDLIGHFTRQGQLTKREIAARKRPLASGIDLKKINLDRALGSLKLMRQVLFVPPSMQAVNLLERMQATRMQMALVIDEYGGTEGLVSLEDVMEVIVGDIEDEHDDDETPLIIDKGDGVFVLDAKAELDDVSEAVGKDFQIGELGEDFDTIGGLVISLAGRLPVRGELIEGLGFEFRIIDADPRRLKRIELSPAKRRRLRKPSDTAPDQPKG